MNTLSRVDGSASVPETTDGTGRRAGHGSENRARPLILKLRVDATEREAIRAAASRAGLEVGSYLRGRALDGPAPPRAVRRPPVEKAALAQALALLGPLADEVRAYRRALSTAAVAHQYSEGQERLHAACDTITEIRAALMQALGRMP